MLSRRRLFQFLAGSPLAGRAMGQAAPEQVLNVFDFEALAKAALAEAPAHFGYLATGVDDDATLRANRQAFQQYQLRPRRLVDVRQVDLSVELFGARLASPILIAPTGSQRAFHPQGELAVARAAAAQRTQLCLSTVTTSDIREVAAAAGQPIWFQLYATSKWGVTEALVRRAEEAGCPVLALTVDLPAGRNTETQSRARLIDKRPCSACHASSREAATASGAFFARKPMFRGIDMTGVTLNNPAMDWAFVRRLKAMTSMKLVLKGIETREDAALAVEHGVDGLVVSNHGGRAEESGRGTLDCLPEVLDGAGKLPVLIDGGFRRGTDVFKALALGARAILIGRPYLWGLAAFGQPGVERVLEILNAELALAMKQCGAQRASSISRTMVVESRTPSAV